MSGDLLALASKYVSLTGEIEDVRRAMLACLTNGAADTAPTPRPMPARPTKPGGHPNAAAAQEAEAKIIELLRATPGIGTAALARATGAKVNTTAERLKRMKAKGLTVGGGADGWTASP
jgi:hypothetical protein